ncbi:MAG: hypothetical protein FJ109_09425 [Deltaproteobacteria bacterium]|nr:hypothetical protein [Deltaproteobacteria bacterium]
MEFLFKRYFWILNSVLLIGAGYAAANAAMSYVEFEVFEVAPADATGDAEEGGDEELDEFRRPTASRSVDLERRMQLLQAAKSEETAEAPPEVAMIEEEVPVEEAPPAEETGGQLDLELIAVITTPQDPSKSMAMVKVDGGEARWVGIGTELKGGFHVSQITNYYITASQGVTELLWKKHEPKGAGPMLAAGGRIGAPARGTEEPVREAAPREPPASSTPYSEGVKQLGPWEYRIDRGMLNEQLQDLAKLGREARVIPNYDKDSGTYKGFKLIGVRPNSLYRALGIRSGDVIQQINGEELSSPGKALELFTQLQNSSSIMLDITRRGKQHSLSYKIE